nr:hypothetical protein [Streptococcus equi]
MTPEEAEKAKIRAKQEIEVFSIYLEQAIDTFGSMLSPQKSSWQQGLPTLALVKQTYMRPSRVV